MGTPIAAPKTVLVYVGADQLGDGLIKLPFAAALRRLYPFAHITWMAGKGRTVYAGALAPIARSYIDEIVEDVGVGSRVHELLRTPLADRHFDLVIDTQRRVLTTLILRRIRCDCFISGTADYFFSDRRPATHYGKAPTMLRQMLDLLEVASGQLVETRDFRIRHDETDRLAQSLLPDGPLYVGLVPGAGGRHKCWPLENHVELARRQAGKERKIVVILGPGETEWYDVLRERLPFALFPLQNAAIDRADAQNPLLTISLATRLHAAVASDCGGGHLVAAGGAPLVSLWKTPDAGKFVPTTHRIFTVSAASYGGETMDAIPVDVIDRTIDCLLFEAAYASQKLGPWRSTARFEGFP